MNEKGVNYINDNNDIKKECKSVNYKIYKLEFSKYKFNYI